ncbi:reverse transcriptase, partial [Penicillium atrosanguineum]
MTPQLSAALPHQSLTPSSITVTLHKGGPKDYRMLKLCRRVALLNTLGKLLKTVIVTRISWAAEKGILPKGRLGGRRGVCRSRNQLILNQVYKAWSMNRKVGILLLDVSGAYDNVSHERLLYNIKKLKLGRFMPGFSPSCKATAPDSDSWGSSTITPSSHAKYLGIWLDKHLDFTTHHKKVIAKANSTLEAFRGIAGSTWGTSLSAMRQIYRAVVIPQLFW